MKKLHEYNFKSQLVIFSDIKNTVAKNLEIKDLYYSRKGERPSRPGLIQKKDSITWCLSYQRKSIQMPCSKSSNVVLSQMREYL